MTNFQQDLVNTQFTKNLYANGLEKKRILYMHCFNIVFEKNAINDNQLNMGTQPPPNGIPLGHGFLIHLPSFVLKNFGPTQGSSSARAIGQ